MRALWAIAAVATVLLVIVVLFWTVRPELGDDSPPPSDKRETALSQPHEEDISPAEEETGTTGDISTPSEPQAERVVPATPKTFISGRVTDKNTGEPVKSFDFMLKYRGPLRTGVSDTAVGETVHSEEGRFFFPLEEGGKFQLIIQSSRHLYYRTDYRSHLEIPEEGGLEDLHIELDPGLGVSGRVVDDATSRPVEGALLGDAHRPRLPWILIYDRPEVAVHAWTDEQGRFTLQGLWGSKSGQLTVAAVHPDFAEAAKTINPDEKEEVELRLKRGFRIYGQARDDEGRPMPDIFISFTSEETPLARPTLTGPDGRYRTAPVPPGEVSITARLWDTEFTQTPAFTEETKKVLVVDRDVEVNFGPDAGHVTWSGTLIDYTGLPLEGAWIQAKSIEAFEPAAASDPPRQGWSGKEGRFKLTKLVPGRYDVKNWVPRPGEEKYIYESMVIHDAVPWGDVVFEEPGEVEQDLHIPGEGSIVAGIVVEECTGTPLLNRYAGVGARKRGEEVDQDFWTSVDQETGCFCLRNLGAGTFNLFLSGPGLHSETRTGFKVSSGQVIEDVVFRVPRMGELHLILEGFSEEELKRGYHDAVRIKLSSSEGSTLPPLNIEKRETMHVLKEGKWEAVIGHEDMGWVTRGFTILRESPVKITVLRGELTLQEADLTVPGRLLSAEGNPLAEAELWFRAKEKRKGWGAAQCVTDKEGAFMAERLMPGHFTVTCRLSTASRTIYIENVLIPENPPKDFHLDLVLPGGKITGTLLDKQTGLPISPASFGWRVCLVKAIGYSWVSQSVEKEGHSFTLFGIPAGEHILTATAPGYHGFQSDPFTFTDGEIKEFGAIHMEPCGVVELEVVDTSGNPLQHYWASCNGKRMGGHTGNEWITSPGKKCFWLLPLGPATIKVDANNHKSQEVSVVLEPARPAKVRMELQPE